MDITLNLQNSIAFTASNQIAEICLPLKALGIIGFQHIKRFSDGSRILLTNLPQLLEYLYQPHIYPLTWYNNDLEINQYHSGWEFWPINSLFNSTDQNRISDDLYENFGIAHGIFYINKQKNHVEIFCFMFSDYSIYKIKLQVLLHFILHFKEKANKIIQQFHHNKVIIPLRKHDFQINNIESELNVLDEIPINKYYLCNSNSNKYLTAREMNCLQWCIGGKTSEEISILLDVSIKTIESHLQNIKKKLDCYKQTQLALAAIRQGILF